MLILPAIDLKDGQCVRLWQGDYGRTTEYGDPVEAATRWLAAGTRYLHVVDLDAAATGQPRNRPAVSAIAAEAQREGVPVQLGGGLRTALDVAIALGTGISRAIVGTAAIETPGLAATLVQRFGAERIIISLDARDGIVATRGWQESSGRPVTELAQELVNYGVTRFVYTDVSRDGTLTAPNVAATAELVQATAAAVIASGGVTTADHIRELAAAGCEGAIIGRALYDGRLALEEALAAAGESAPAEDEAPC